LVITTALVLPYSGLSLYFWLGWRLEKLVEERIYFSLEYLGCQEREFVTTGMCTTFWRHVGDEIDKDGKLVMVETIFTVLFPHLKF